MKPPKFINNNMSFQVNLPCRGESVIEKIDLFDECQFGADKLYFRGRFDTLEEIRDQIVISLGYTNILNFDALREKYGADATDEDIKMKLGIGNPLLYKTSDGTITNVPTIALNRYKVPGKKFWNKNERHDTSKDDITEMTPDMFPYKADYALRYKIRLHFFDDYGYIDFGMPWTEDVCKQISGWMYNSPNLDGASIGVYCYNFRILNTHFIDKYDAVEILKKLDFSSFIQSGQEIPWV